ncbi:hypothetical protein BJ742DRAFT_801166, partial [Cladochytrium replicatum]
MSSAYSAGDPRLNAVPRSATLTGDVGGNEIDCELLTCSKLRPRLERSSTVDIMDDDTTDFETLYESLKDYQVPHRLSVRVDEQIPEANDIHKFFVGDEPWWEDEKPAMLPDFSQTTRRGSCSVETSEFVDDSKLKHGRFAFFTPIEEQFPFVPGIMSLQSWDSHSRPQSTLGNEPQSDADAIHPSLLDRSFEEVAPLEKRWLALDEEESNSSSESEPSNADTVEVSDSFGKSFQSCNSEDRSLEWSSIADIDPAISFSAAASPIPFDSFDGDDSTESTTPPLSLVDGSKARVKAQTKNQPTTPPVTINLPSLVLLPPLQPLATISPTV